MSIILFFDCFILALTVSIGKKANQEGKFILLLFKTFFDKMILSVLSLQVTIVYAGIIHTDYYYSHEKSFVKIGNAICAIISGALAAIYTSIRWVKDDKGNSIFDYDLDDDNNGKIKMRSLATKIIETIFCGINLIVIVFFLVVVILHISRKRREAKAGLIQDLGYGNQLLRFSLIFSVKYNRMCFCWSCCEFCCKF